MKPEIHELRTRIDGLAGLVESLGTASMNIYESRKSLLLAKAWLGKVLAELGEETPYKKDGNRKTVEDVEPTADKSKLDSIGIDWNEASLIEKIDWLREEISKIDGFDSKQMSGVAQEATNMSVRHLYEARFHLGFALSQLKDQA